MEMIMDNDVYKVAIQNYRKNYEMLLPEINANIEKYRKGNFKIKVVDKNGIPVNATIKAEQKNHAFDFGTAALRIGDMGDKEQAYRDSVSNLFNLITTTFCWSVMETESGKYRFEEGSEEIFRRPPSDRVLRFAQENNMRIKGQPLFCGRWCPDWVPQDLDSLKAYWKSFVKEVARRYDATFNIFDVVNEFHNYPIGTWKKVSWIPEPAFDFVKWLLQTAGEMFSDNCIMERNEGTPVNYLERGERYYRENKELLEEGIRLDAIGFQFHFMYGEACMDRHITGDASLHNIYSTYHKMATLNIPMYISEVTIPTVFEGMSQREGEEFQAEILEKLYRLWFSIPNMQGVIYWNFMDGKAWKSEGDADPGLIDGYLRKKTSYYTLEHLIKREWNTCLTSENDDNGVLAFSGFYGDYDITVITEDAVEKKQCFSFDKETDTVTISM